MVSGCLLPRGGKALPGVLPGAEDVRRRTDTGKRVSGNGSRLQGRALDGCVERKLWVPLVIPSCRADSCMKAAGS